MEPDGASQNATDFLFGRGASDGVVPPPRVRGVRLDRLIGEGAFGTVWQGEQFEPVLRPVAVKVLRIASLGAHAARRFEAEKLALARLEHPHIAHILDAGTTSEGSPYLVMEYVSGVAFDVWCHQHRDDLEARVRMMALVARAIAYAHRQGILHRDLKPANVLVRSSHGTTSAGTDEPCVIDFGVAKLVGDDSLRTATMHGPAAATPLYMSPEIAAGNTEIDGRVDVWSLGVMLYEALVGTRPFASSKSGMAATLELQKAITEGPVPRPSEHLSVSAPRALHRALEDDLDWIVLKALARPASRRYLTPDEFADDLERWIRGEPVSVRASNRGYRARKFVRRNRAAVAAGACALIAMVASVGVLIGSSARAERDARRWREVARFNERLLTAIDPAVAQGLDPTLLRLVLSEAESELARTTRDPEVEAEIRMSLGNAYAATGESERALAAYAQVRTLTAASGGSAESMRHIANAAGRVLIEAGRLDEASAQLALALDGRDAIAASAFHNRAALERARGDLQAAETSLREALRLKRALQSDGDSITETDILDSEQELALVLAESGAARDAEILARDVARARTELLGSRHPDTLRARNNLAEVLLSRGAFLEARASLEETTNLLKQVLGDRHPDTLAARNNLAGALRELDEIDAAIALYRDVREQFNNTRGVEDPRTILASANLALALARSDAQDEAEHEYTLVAAQALKVLGPTHRITLAIEANHAAHLVVTGRAAEAAVLLDRTVPLLERDRGPAHPMCVAARTTLAKARLALGDPSQALSIVRASGVLATNVAARGQPLTRIERRAVEVAEEAAKLSGDAATLAECQRLLATIVQ
ncbi:MAG: serine/threonine-protein kinase [Limnohabitans sp.]|jgi:non-specific serine/threonine protein kinase/serine/threonine-protein kinase|nr:serine/threonine-protein kinase [Limnohabitans sp.]